MDLRLEKADLLSRLGIGEEEADRFHFATDIDHQAREAPRSGRGPRLSGEHRTR